MVFYKILFCDRFAQLAQNYISIYFTSFMNLSVLGELHPEGHRRYYGGLLKDIEPIFTYFRRLGLNRVPDHVLQRISQETHIKAKTLSSWRVKIAIDPKWRPTDHPADHLRVFPIPLEQEFAQNLISEIDSGKAMTADEVEDRAVTFFQAHTEDVNRDSFSASARWRKRFFDENKLSMRRTKPKRRPVTLQRYMDIYMENFQRILNTYPANRVANMDETSVKLCYHHILTVARKNADVVPGIIDGDDKACFTAVGTIRSDGKKMPMTIISKYRPSVFSPGCDDYDSYIEQNTNGWMDETYMLRWLKLFSDWMNNEKCALILDVFPAHRTQAVKDLAKELNIELLFVPAGATDRFQPLDRHIYGGLKSRIRSKFTAASRNRRQNFQYNFSNAAKILLSSWNELLEVVVISAFKID